MLSWEGGERVGDVQVDHCVRRLFVVALLDQFEELVAPVSPPYAVLVCASRVVYLLFICVVNRCSCEASKCCAYCQWAEAVVSL